MSGSALLAPEAGRLLVATPALLDPNFLRTVVLICRYDPSVGTVGLVLNRPSAVNVGKVLPKLARDRKERLWVGGPVDGRSLWVVHRRGELAKRAVEIGGGVYFGADPVMIRRLLRRTEPDPAGETFKLFVGYAGWSEGQLEAEIEEGAWRVVPAGPGALFGSGAEQLWGEMWLRSLLPRAQDPDLIASAWLN